MSGSCDTMSRTPSHRVWSKALRRRGSLATLSSGFRRPEPLRLGAWRLPATLFAVALVTVGALIPIGRLLFEAGGGPKAEGFSLAVSFWTCPQLSTPSSLRSKI